MASHLFVLRGDLSRLSCDAWLLPSDADLNVEDTWARPLEALGLELRRDVSWSRRRVMKAQYTTPRGDVPQPWFADVGIGLADTPYFVGVVREFLAAVKHDLRGRREWRGRRERGLVALPIVGTGLGGGHHKRGEIIRSLVTTLEREVRKLPFDLALVAYEDSLFAAAQRARASWEWPELGAGQRDAARRLASLADAGRLVVFLGAGVSAAAGLPTWRELLDALAREARLSPAERQELQKRSAQDYASLVADRIDARARGGAAGVRPVARLVAGLVRHHRHPALAHYLLADLPVSEIITTNYDRLFEAAAVFGDRPEPLSVLPYRPAKTARRWLLKLHGCVSRPSEIVLTRADYMRYGRQRAALAGIVQAMLLTKHMLFVGFSLADENFHRIADEVRVALPPGRRGGRFGTVLTLARDRLLEELWGEDLEFCAMDEGTADPANARKLEIFLDFLAANTHQAPSYLLDERYADLLSAEERHLSQAVRAFAAEFARVPPGRREGSAWQEATRFLGRVGAKLPGTGGA